MEKITASSFGKWLKDEATARGIKFARFEKQAKLSRQSMQRYMYQGHIPRLDAFELITDALGYDICLVKRDVADEIVRKISGLSEEDYEEAKAMCDLMCGGVEDD